MNRLLDILREATRESHRQLETELRVETRLADRASYRSLLEGFLGLHEPLEIRLAACAPLPALGYRMAERTKLPALRRDLEALGLEGAGIIALPRYKAPPLEDVGAALGAAYVLEGSTLGGQSITRMINEGGYGLPAEFFNVYGAQTRERWLAFLRCLEAYEGNPQPAAEAACATFDAFRQWLT